MSKEIKKNFDIPNGETLEQIVAKAVAQAEARINAKNAKSKSNAIQLGATVKDLEVREGSEIIDKNTGEVKTDSNTGEVKRYPNKYSVVLVFTGGSIKQDIKAHQFDMLEINKDYFCTGYLGEVSSFGKTEILPIFTDFEPLSA